ncbi:MAG TPA: hypothetical protein VE888_00995 [Streptosporangiaceae bacterium]|jgi:hypothetical protein|nr:hypothetical protein [Streptosporangiaceae bacterium]
MLAGADLAPWAAMNTDPEVRRHVGPLLTFEQAAAWLLNYQDDLDRYGYGGVVADRHDHRSR